MPLAQVTEGQHIGKGSSPFAVLLLVLFTVTCNMAELQMDRNMLQCNTFTAGEETPPRTLLLNAKAVFAFPNLCCFLNTEIDDYCSNGQLSCGQTLKWYFKQLVINIKSEYYDSQEKKMKADPGNSLR